jgi:hypothetical protein
VACESFRLRHWVGLLGQEIGQSQSVYLHRTQKNADINDLRVVPTLNFNVRRIQDRADTVIGIIVVGIIIIITIRLLLLLFILLLDNINNFGLP